MKRSLFAVIAITLTLILSGCGGSNSPSFFVSQILSSQANDGDIEQTSTGSFIVNQGGLASVFAGLDNVTGSEFRAFLDFPLTGAGGVPGNAFIDSATLNIYIDSYRSTAATTPIRIELVSFPPSPLLASDFDRGLQPPITFIQSFIAASDVHHHVIIDVTPLMLRAQSLGLANFQLRVLEDLGIVTPGLFEIDETTTTLAPLLEVVYH